MVSDFMHRYKKAIDVHYFKEKEKDVRTKSTWAILKTPLKIEEEAATVYTRKSFTIFQVELFDSLWYQAKNLSKEGETKTYGVITYGKETPLYHVTLEAKLDRLPQCYILDRWTMNAKSRPIPDIPCSEGQVQQGEDEATMRKFKSMIQLYDIVELASQSTEKHNHFTLALEKVHKELLAMEDHVECSQRGEGTNNDQILRSQVVSNFSQTVQDPSRVPTKGRPKSLRANNLKESQPIKKRHCTICKNEGHTRNNSPLVRASKGLVATFVVAVVEVRRIRELPCALLRQRGDSLVALRLQDVRHEN
ncbi:hypothetical protein Q3G72_012661 [Acer saccharum]|nr:hypothetical protein Q3G72_012661 [Acer saccharum]